MRHAWLLNSPLFIEKEEHKDSMGRAGLIAVLVLGSKP